MTKWLKWLVASREMAELERYRVATDTACSHLAPYPDAADALDYVRATAGGYRGVTAIYHVRDALAARRRPADPARPGVAYAFLCDEQPEPAPEPSAVVSERWPRPALPSARRVAYRFLHMHSPERA